MFFLIITSIIVGYLIIAALLIYLINRNRRKPGRFFDRHRIFAWVATGILAIGVVAAVDARFIEPNIIRVKEQVIPFPISRQIRVGLIADPQVGMHKRTEWVEKIVARANEVQPDIILIAGDLISNEQGTNEDESVYLEPLKALVGRYPVYYVLGNHDYGIGYRSGKKYGIRNPDKHDLVMARMEKIGIPLLRNDLACPEIKQQKQFCIFGTDDIWGSTADYDRLAKWNQKDPMILLSHNPDAILSWPQEIKKPDLILAGHTHGGQVYIPFLGPLGDAGLEIGKQHYRWLSYWNGIPMFVTVGVGESLGALRFFTPAEIAVVELTP